MHSLVWSCTCVGRFSPDLRREHFQLQHQTNRNHLRSVRGVRSFLSRLRDSTSPPDVVPPLDFCLSAETAARQSRASAKLSLICLIRLQSTKLLLSYEHLDFSVITLSYQVQDTRGALHDCNKVMKKLNSYNQ